MLFRSGVVSSGTAITLSSVDDAATIYYQTSLGDEQWLLYEQPIIVDETITISAKSVVDELESETVAFSYIVKSDTEEPSGDLFDPITVIPEGAISIEDAMSVEADTIGVTVVGQLVYRFGNYN